MMKRIVLIGDSIRMNYVPLVCTALAGQAVVWAPDENCETSAKVLAHLDEWVIAHHPDIVHINCGLHDLRYNPGASQRVVSPTEYAVNVQQIMERLTSKTCSHVIWATITPVNETWHQANKLSRRYEADVTLYNQVAVTIVSQYDALINDLFEAVTSVGKNKLLRKDGVHFTEQGDEFLSERVTRMIRQATERVGEEREDVMIQPPNE